MNLIMNLINFNNKLLSRLCVSSIRLLSMRSMYTIDKEEDYEKEVLTSERTFENLNSKQFESLAQNMKQLNEIELILIQYENIKYSSLEVPSTLTHENMKELLSLQTLNSRNRFLNYLFKKEIYRLIRIKKQLLDKSLKDKQLKDKWSEWNSEKTGIFSRDRNIVYGLWHNSMFTRISPQNLRHLAANRLRNASLFGQNIVFDLSNNDEMTEKHCKSIASQIHDCYVFNRKKTSEPFNLYICNIDYNSLIWKTIQQRLPFFGSSDFFVNCTEKSYLDIFRDPSKLVYLSSKAEKTINYDHNCVYILSSFDENNPQPLVEVKLKHENIEVQRLPIDEHVLWNMGSKDLRLSNVFSILYDIKEGMQWAQAIQRNVNPRHMKTPEMVAKEEFLKFEKIKQKFSLKNSNKINVNQLFED